MGNSYVTARQVAGHIQQCRLSSCCPCSTRPRTAVGFSWSTQRRQTLRKFLSFDASRFEFLFEAHSDEVRPKRLDILTVRGLSPRKGIIMQIVTLGVGRGRGLLSFSTEVKCDVTVPELMKRNITIVFMALLRE